MYLLIVYSFIFTNVIERSHSCSSPKRFSWTHLVWRESRRRSRFGSTEPPSWASKAANQRQTWVQEIAELPQSQLLIGLFKCWTRWPRRPDSIFEVVLVLDVIIEFSLISVDTIFNFMVWRLRYMKFTVPLFIWRCIFHFFLLIIFWLYDVSLRMQEQ